MHMLLCKTRIPSGVQIIFTSNKRWRGYGVKIPGRFTPEPFQRLNYQTCQPIIVFEGIDLSNSVSCYSSSSCESYIYKIRPSWSGTSPDSARPLHGRRLTLLRSSQSQGSKSDARQDKSWQILSVAKWSKCNTCDKFWPPLGDTSTKNSVARSPHTSSSENFPRKEAAEVEPGLRSVTDLVTMKAAWHYSANGP